MYGIITCVLYLVLFLSLSIAGVVVNTQNTPLLILSSLSLTCFGSCSLCFLCKLFTSSSDYSVCDNKDEDSKEIERNIASMFKIKPPRHITVEVCNV